MQFFLARIFLVWQIFFNILPRIYNVNTLILINIYLRWNCTTISTGGHGHRCQPDG